MARTAPPMAAPAHPEGAHSLTLKTPLLKQISPGAQPLMGPRRKIYKHVHAVSPDKYNVLRHTQGPVVPGGLRKYTSHSPQYPTENCSHLFELPSSKVRARICGDDPTEGSSPFDPLHAEGSKALKPHPQKSVFQPTSDGAQTGPQGRQRHLRASLVPVGPHPVHRAPPPKMAHLPRG